MAVIDQIYEAVSDDEAFGRLPSILAPLVGARSCLIAERSAQLENVRLLTNYFSDDLLNYAMDPEVSSLDYWARYSSQPHTLSRTIDSDDVWGTKYHLQSGFYNEIFRKFGDDTARSIGKMAQCPTGYLSISFHTGLGAKRYGPRDAEEVTAIFPHVCRLLELRERLRMAQETGDLLQRALDQMSDGVLALDGAMRVRAGNRRGQAMLAKGDGLSLVRGRVTASDGNRQDRLARAVRSAATWSGGRGDAILLPRLEGRPALRVLVSPMSGPHALALVIIEDPEDTDPGLAATLARLYGLTPSEAELAALLVGGATPEEAAEARDVRLSTVRTQIKRLLDKTEAHRLLDLVRILSRTPRGAPGWDGGG